MKNRTPKIMSGALLAAALCGFLSVTLTGCPREGLVCSEGLTACGDKTCEDLSNDQHNCGACGKTCGVGEICSNGQCECATGAIRCPTGESGVCVVTRSNPQFCSPNPDVCGTACAAGEVCEEGQCKADCAVPGNVRCGNSCVDLGTDTQNCGACGNVCPQGQSCREGQCRYDVIAACFTNGQVRGLQADTFVSAPLKQLGSAPQALAAYGHEVLLSADGMDNALYQARLATLEQFGNLSNALASIPNDVLVDEPYVYVINSGAGTLLVLKGEALLDAGTPDAGEQDAGEQDAGEEDAGMVADAWMTPDAGSFDGGGVDGGMSGDGGFGLDAGLNLDGGLLDAGLFWAGGEPLHAGHGPQFPNGVQFQPVREVQFGDNTWPQVMVKVGTKLYVTLYGGTTAATSGAGQKVVAVDISNPENAALTGESYDLTTLPLEAFTDGGTTIPRPQGITERNGTLYVALNNLDTFYSVAGPGYLATIPLDGGSMGLVKLPEDSCLNAVWTERLADHVVVSCAGQTDYSNFPVVSTTESGLALVGPNDQVLSSHETGCPAGDDAGCAAVSYGRFAVVGSSVYVADQAAGRLFVYDVQNNALVERRTYGQGQPLLVCPVNPMTGYSNVSDVFAAP